MRQAQAIWLITQSQGADIKLKKAIKNHEKAIKNLYIQGTAMGNDQHKVQEEYEALSQRHGRTKRTPTT